MCDCLALGFKVLIGRYEIGVTLVRLADVSVRRMMGTTLIWFQERTRVGLDGWLSP